MTIAFLPIERLWATRFEASLDRGVVGEAEPQAVTRELASLGAPGARRFGDRSWSEQVAPIVVIDRR